MVAKKLGSDVKVCPCQTIIPLYRNHVFAEVRSAAISRIDVDLALKGFEEAKQKPPTRLLATGGLDKGDRTRIVSRSPASMTSTRLSIPGS